MSNTASPSIGVSSAACSESDLFPEPAACIAALAAGDVGVWELDFIDPALRANATFLRHFALPFQATVDSKAVCDRVHPHDRARLSEALQASRTTGAALDIEVRIPRSDTWMGWIRLKAEVLPGREGRGARLVGVAMDVTAIRRADEEHRKMGTLLRAVLETVPGLIYAKDCEGRMLVANAAVLELIGKPWPEVQGRTDVEFLDDPTQGEVVMQNDRRVMANGRAEAIEESVGKGSGPTRVYLSTKAPLYDDEGVISGLVGISQDISDRKRAEENLMKLNETLESRVSERTAALERKAAQLEIANKELESFSYSVSHDLRAPLRAIDGFSQIIEEDCGEALDAEGRRCLRVIRSNTGRMGALIDDLLAFSRLSRLPIAANEVNTVALIQEVLPEILNGSVGLLPQIEIGELPAAWGDRNLLRQVWTNLLGNAVKYTSKTASPRIEIDGRCEHGETVFRVRDNGIGFNMDYVEKLFGVFQRLHHNDEFSGTGVGLAIVHRIVTRHGGRIWAHGEVNRGAEFSFALPIGD